MQLKFKNIRYKNFLSVGNEWLNISLDSHDTTLMIGKNGSGKSTLLCAITFALFNKPFRKINLPQLVNSVTKKNSVVEIEFDVGKTQYKIVRGQKPKLFEIFVNGTLKNQDADSNEQQEYLEKHILKANYKAFCQVVILGSATYLPFMSLTVPVRREIIENLLDLNVFSTMNVLLKDKISSNNAALKDLEITEKSVKDKIDLTKKHLSEIKGNNDELISEKETALALAIKDEKKYNASIEKSKAELKEAQELLVDDTIHDAKIKKFNELRTELTQEQRQLNTELKFLNDHDDCPTCDQAITEDFKTKSITEKSDRNNEISDGMKKVLEKLAELDKKKKALTATNNNTNSHVSGIRTTIANINGQLSGVARLKSSLTAEIAKLKVKTENIEEDGRLEALETELEGHQANKGKFLEEKKTLAAAALMLKDNGIKAHVVKQYIPKINELLSKYLAALEFFTQFSLNENFEETILSRNKNDFSYESFSEGQKVRINLAILFTWRTIAKMRNSLTTNMIILDEILDSSLDDNGIDAFMKAKLLEGQNAFIVSHRGDTMIDKFDRTLKFSLAKNMTRMEE